MVCLPTGIPVADYQAEVLNYLVQEALAHAALIFATLAAAFTFASGFKNTVAGSKSAIYVYAGLLSILFSVAIYSFLRFAFYADLTDFLLNQAQAPTCMDTLTSYWNSGVKVPAQLSSRWLLPFSGLYNVGVDGFIISLLLACLFAFLITCLASRTLSQISSRSLIRIIALILVYCSYLMIADYLLTGPEESYDLSAWPGVGLFVICVIMYGDRWWSRRSYSSKNMHKVLNDSSKLLRPWIRRNIEAILTTVLDLSTLVFFALFTVGLEFRLLTGYLDMKYLREVEWPLQGHMSVFAALSIYNICFIILALHKENSLILYQLKNPSASISSILRGDRGSASRAGGIHDSAAGRPP